MALHVDLGASLRIPSANRSKAVGSRSATMFCEGIRLVALREQGMKELDAMLEQASDELDAGLGIPAEGILKS